MGPRVSPGKMAEVIREPPGTADEMVRSDAAPSTAKVQRRGKDAILDSDDCELIAFDLFEDRV